VRTHKKQILILQEDHNFQKKLVMACRSLGEIVSAKTPAEALETISLRHFDMLLLQWDVFLPDGALNFNAFSQLQPQSKKIALFQVPELSCVVSAMKAGFDDILWAKIAPVFLYKKIKNALALSPANRIRHTHLFPLLESQAQRSLDEKATLVQARKDFYGLFLKKILIYTNWVFSKSCG
jgi:DNA-binding NtrC family response regulator